MDKKLLLSKSLAEFMKIYLPSINDVVSRYPQAKIQIKADGSPVTELDLQLSSKIEEIFKEKFTFYSEEKFDEWKFPMLVLDPLDGTREYIEGRSEWAISIGLFENENFVGEGWVYNPKTSELYDQGRPKKFELKNKYSGEVSRSEWAQGLYKNKSSDKFEIKPAGSIAYKLGKLSNHQCDFVVSLRPKNIWDIAGGTLLCHEAGYKFYSQGKEVTSVKQLYQPPLIWCHEELFSELSEIYP